MNDLQRILRVARRLRNERLSGLRLKLMMPILLLFLPGLAWGFSDPNIVLPGGHQPDNAMEVLFYASLGVVFGATMCAVLQSFDGVSRDRASGMLEVRLAQPMPRSHQAAALVLGHAQGILVPVYALLVLCILVARYRVGDWLSVEETVVYVLSTGLIVVWYTLFALIASTSANEQGTAVAFGVGVWFFFTFLWALVTTMVAYASGVDVGQPNELLRAQKTLMEDYASLPFSFPAGFNVLENDTLVGPSTAVGGTVTRSTIGRFSTVEQGALVSDSLLMDGCMVHSGAVVKESVLGTRVVVPNGARVEGCVIGDGVVLTSLGTYQGQRIPNEGK